MLYLNNTGLVCTLGSSRDEVAGHLQRLTGEVDKPGMMSVDPKGRVVGRVDVELPELPAALTAFNCRNNRLAAAALEQIRPNIESAVHAHGTDRIGVVMGTSTSGIAATEDAVSTLKETGDYPVGYHAIQGALGGLGEFVARYFGLTGPAYTVSTACSSGGNALLAARRLIRLGLCDAVVAGGADSLCEMTLQGFSSLEALSIGHSRPFSAGRDGINIGEAAAAFLVSREPGPVRFCGGACTSDAHHISAPHPEGRGAFAAMNEALQDAGLEPEAVSYLNLHGTGTPHNDSMESLAVYRLFGGNLPCSSSKPFTGHTLGAAAALELAICWLLLNEQDPVKLPPTAGLEDRDPDLPPIGLVVPDDAIGRLSYCMSNSFAFGGNNVSLVIGKSDV